MTSDLELIKQLEKEIGIKLKERKFEEIGGYKEQGYAIGENGEVVGLNLDEIELKPVPVSLSKFHHLKILRLYNTKLTDISFLQGLSNPTLLNLSSNQIKDFSFLKGLINLTQLDLNDNQITDISFLQGLRKLTQLYLSENQIKDISFLKGLINLTQLDLMNNPIIDISFLQELRKLTSLDLRFNQIKELPEALVELGLEIDVDNIAESKQKIYLYGNPLEKPPLEIIRKGIPAIKAYFYSLKQEKNLQKYTESKTKMNIQPEKEIYISYAWGGESEEIANRLDEAFKEKGITIIRDKRDLGFKGRIKEFMERIGRGKCVVLVISNKYLESRNCMFELMQIAKSGDFYGRIFPVVLDDAKIYDPVERIEYVKYWEKKKKALDDQMKSVSSEYLYGFREDIDLYADIRQYLPRLTDILRDMNTLTVEIHSETGFEELVRAAAAKIEE